MNDIRLLILDVDGVMTDGSIVLDNDGQESKRFNVKDGLGMKLWMMLGYELAIITARSSGVVRQRARELGVNHLYQGISDKAAALRDLMVRLDISAAQIAVLGDDLTDLPMLNLAGYPMTVADAVDEVRSVAQYETQGRGGDGAVREAIEHLLKSAGRWNEAVATYGEPLPEES